MRERSDRAVRLSRSSGEVAAALAAALLASAVAPHPVVLWVALGVGAFALLVALFFTISTVLHARERGGGRS